MRVFELIEELNQFPPDYEVYVGISCDKEAKAITVLDGDMFGDGWVNCITIYGSEYVID